MKYYRVDGIGDLDADHPTPYDYLFNIWLESWIKEPGSDYWYAEDYFTVNVFQFVLLWLLGWIKGSEIYEFDQTRKSHYRSHREWVRAAYTKPEPMRSVLTVQNIEDLIEF